MPRSCPECKVREDDFSVKDLKSCSYCGRLFCERHVPPKLAFFSMPTELTNVKDRGYRQALYDDMQRRDSHPCVPYTIVKSEEMKIDKTERIRVLNELLQKQAPKQATQKARRERPKRLRQVGKSSRHTSKSRVRYIGFALVFLMIFYVVFEFGFAYGQHSKYEDAYNSGYLQGLKEGAGKGYTLRDPTYEEVLDLLSKDKTDRNSYDPDEYTCMNYAADLKTGAFQAGYRCGYVELWFPVSSHALNVFATVDRGLVFVEPQSDEIVKVIVGEHYWDQTKYMEPTYDDTIVRYAIFW